MFSLDAYILIFWSWLHRCRSMPIKTRSSCTDSARTLGMDTGIRRVIVWLPISSDKDSVSRSRILDNECGLALISLHYFKIDPLSRQAVLLAGLWVIDDDLEDVFARR